MESFKLRMVILAYENRHSKITEIKTVSCILEMTLESFEEAGINFTVKYQADISILTLNETLNYIKNGYNP